MSPDCCQLRGLAPLRYATHKRVIMSSVLYGLIYLYLAALKYDGEMAPALCNDASFKSITSGIGKSMPV